jgi:colicin import membrane protein
MKKILSAVVATLVAVSFSAVVFAADAAKPATLAAPTAVTVPAGEVQKDAKAIKAEEKAAKAKAKAEAKEAKAKAKADAKAAKAKAKADAKEAKAKAKADAKATKDAAPVTK